MAEAAAAVEEVLRLFREHGEGVYLAEAVTTTQHSLQCGMLALREDAPLQVVVGAFLHDIGHLVGADRGLAAMVTEGTKLGAAHHDTLGGEYLRGLGFPPTVCDLVAGHVQAKRYRVWKDPAYYNALSSASKMTLEHQGGPMSREEAQAFQASPLFKDILRMRGWDEQAKDPNMETDSLEKFQSLCLQVLEEARQ